MDFDFNSVDTAVLPASRVIISFGCKLILVFVLEECAKKAHSNLSKESICL